MQRIQKTLLAAALATLPASLVAATQCDTFFFKGVTQQVNSNQEPYVGGMMLENVLTGRTYQADVETMLLGFTGPEGSKAVTSHAIRVKGSPGIDIVTFDKAYILPTDLPWEMTLSSHLEVKTGTGAYNCGELVTDPAHSTLSFDEQGRGTAEYQGLAKLCRCKPADN